MVGPRIYIVSAAWEGKKRCAVFSVVADSQRAAIALLDRASMVPPNASLTAVDKQTEPIVQIGGNSILFPRQEATCCKK